MKNYIEKYDRLALFLIPLPIITCFLAWGSVAEWWKGGLDLFDTSALFVIVIWSIICVITLPIAYYKRTKIFTHSRQLVIMILAVSWPALLLFLIKIPSMFFCTESTDYWVEYLYPDKIISSYTIAASKPFQTNFKPILIFIKDEKEHKIDLEKNYPENQVVPIIRTGSGENSKKIDNKEYINLDIYNDIKNSEPYEWGRLIKFKDSYYVIGYTHFAYGIWQIDFGKDKSVKLFKPFTDEYRQLVIDILKFGGDFEVNSIIFQLRQSISYPFETPNDKPRDFFNKEIQEYYKSTLDDLKNRTINTLTKERIDLLYQRYKIDNNVLKQN